MGFLTFSHCSHTHVNLHVLIICVRSVVWRHVRRSKWAESFLLGIQPIFPIKNLKFDLIACNMGAFLNVDGLIRIKTEVFVKSCEISCPCFILFFVGSSMLCFCTARMYECTICINEIGRKITAVWPFEPGRSFSWQIRNIQDYILLFSCTKRSWILIRLQNDCFNYCNLNLRFVDCCCG